MGKRGRRAADDLVGRVGELEALVGVLRVAAAGRGAQAFIEGDAGIGKSALLAAAGEAARSMGCLVLSGRADAVHTTRPFRALVHALAISERSPDEERASLARLLAGREQLPEGAELSAVATERFVSLVERHGLAGPTLLLVDDLHFCDAGTCEALRSMAERLTDLPLAIFVAARPRPRTAQVAGLVAGMSRDGATFVSLRPLGSEELRQLVQAAHEGASPESVEVAVARAAGNPLFATEIVRFLTRLGTGIPLEGGEALVSTELQRLIAADLATLPSATVKTLHAAAVLGVSFDPAVLARVLKQPRTSVLENLAAALDAGVLVEERDAIAFRHDLVRDAVYLDVPSAVRAAFHVEVARRLETSDSTDEVASHLLAVPAASADVELIERVAYATQRTSPAASIALFNQAIARAASEDRSRLAAARLVPLYSLGRYAEIAEVGEALLETLEDEDMAGRTLILVLGAKIRRGDRGVVSMIEDALGRRDLRPEVEVRLRAVLAESRLLEGNVDRALDEVALVEAAAGDGFPVDLMHVLATKALALAAKGQVLEATDLARSLSDHVKLGVGLFGGIVLIDADELGAAGDALDTAMEIASHREPSQVISFQWTRASIAYLTGAWDEAQADAEAALEVVLERGEHVVGTFFGVAVLALMALQRDGPEAAERYLRVGDARLEESGPELGADLFLWARASAAESAGDLATARQYLELAWDGMATVRYLATWRTIAPELVRVALATEDRALAQRVATIAEEGARRAAHVASARAAALRCTGLVHSDRACLDEAVSWWRKSGRVVELAAAAEDAARLAVEQQDVARARSHFRDALDVYERLDAARATERVTASLTSLGVRRAPRPPRARFGWESLTPAESRVVELVASGLPNPEIASRLHLSRFTVETHLRHVFQKLGIRSRVQLAAESVKRAGANTRTQ